MTNIFANKKAAANDKVETDFVGGGGVLPTDVYKGTIKYAYIGKSNNSDARSVTICMVTDGKEVRQTIWVTTGQGEVTYKDQKTGDPKNLPGYNQVNSLAMLLASKEIGELEVEDKTLKLWNSEQKAEVPTSVQCFVELHGQELQAAIQEQLVDKTAKGDDGKYHPTGETRKVNEFIKFMPAERRVTLSEVAHQINSLGGTLEDVLRDGDMDKAIASMTEDGSYITTWLEKNQGEVYDKSTKTEGKSFGGSKAGSGSGEAGTKKPSLFD